VVESDPRSGSPRLLVLGAGPAQLGLLEAARGRGHWVAAVDRDPGAPGFRHADRRCILSTEDEPAIERLVGALGIEGIIAPGTDWPVAVAARVADHVGLPHPISPQTAVLATNKLRQRERLAEAGVPQPRSWVVGSVDEPPLIDGPVVVKAPDRQGQKGLTLVADPSELPAAIDTARGAARSGLALVEELVDGPEVTVVGFSIDGDFTALTVTDRITADPPAFGVALAHVWPSHVGAQAADVAAAAVSALGISNGPSYTQLRVGPDGPQVIEVAARLGGGHDAELAEAAVGVDVNGLALDKIERQMVALRETDSKLTLLSSPWAYFYHRTNQAQFVRNALWEDLTPVEWLIRKLGLNLHMQNATYLVSRELAEAAGPWDTTLNFDQDGDYFCRVLMASEETRFVPEARVFYRASGSNRISFIGNSNRKKESLLRSMKVHVGSLRSLEESDRVRAACLTYLQTWYENFYPDQPDMMKELQALAADLGGELKEPALRWKYAWMKPIFGWNAAKRAQSILPEWKGDLLKRWDKTMFNWEASKGNN